MNYLYLLKELSYGNIYLISIFAYFEQVREAVWNVSVVCGVKHGQSLSYICRYVLLLLVRPT